MLPLLYFASLYSLSPMGLGGTPAEGPGAANLGTKPGGGGGIGGKDPGAPEAPGTPIGGNPGGMPGGGTIPIIAEGSGMT